MRKEGSHVALCHPVSFTATALLHLPILFSIGPEGDEEAGWIGDSKGKEGHNAVWW